MLRSIGRQSGESVESVPKKKSEATVGRICRKGRFQAWDDESEGVNSWTRFVYFFPATEPCFWTTLCKHDLQSGPLVV